MTNVVASQHQTAPEADRPTAFDRMASFRFTYLAIFVFLLLYVFSVQIAQRLLDEHFETLVAEAASSTPSKGSVVAHIQEEVRDAVQGSVWVRTWGVSVTPIVLGADGRILYVGGHSVRQAARLDPVEALEEARDVLPVSTDVVTTVPHGSLLANTALVVYAALLVQLLFVRSRAQARREAERFEAAMLARDSAAQRAKSIEGELETVRGKLSEVEPERQIHTEEIQQLERERSQLQRQLERLAKREEELRRESRATGELHEEHQALEELLDEALRDLASRDEAIQTLETRLKRASRSSSAHALQEPRDR
jgi:DNA repair exonuclease SbcCD ATPase subunit